MGMVQVWSPPSSSRDSRSASLHDVWPCWGEVGVSYLAPGFHLPLLTGLQVTAHALRGRNAGQELAVKGSQAPVMVPAVHALNLPDLEASAAVSGTLCGEQKQQ